MRVFGRKAFFIFPGWLFLIVLLTAQVALGQNMFRKVNDFDGDRKADFAVVRNVGGVKIWYIWKSASGFTAYQYGLETDQAAAGDYDGDGKTDIAVFRQTPNATIGSDYSFWIIGSLFNMPRTITWSYYTYAGSVPLQQDYDGDGKTDAAWTIDDGTRYFLAGTRFGGSTGITSPGGTFIKIGDMDGDAYADTAAYYPGFQHVSIRHSLSGTTRTVHFGAPGDEYVAADFDGDAKGDLTVFRQSNGEWWWMKSSDNTVQAAVFGAVGDVPVPADYDGDGKTDLAIWRSGAAAQSYFWVYGSQAGVSVMPWGVAGDTVVRY